MNSAPKTYGRRNDKLRYYALLLGILIAIICCIVGAVLLINSTYEEGYEIEKDYTNCKNDDLPYPLKCKDRYKDKECTCYIEMEIKELMKAPVTVFYELDSYEQMISNYAQSRDDNQLAGYLSQKPSARCNPSTYNLTEGVKTPIAPCGLLADAMFNDSFTLQINNDYVPKIAYGLISEDDKKQFHNPPGDLAEAFKNFSKPINWRKDVYKLDTNNPENNGFRNEAFIIWMNTDLKRKPAWRVNHTGEYESGVFPANYTLGVTHEYPTSRYDGRRKFIISSVHKFEDSLKYAWGVALLVIGVTCFVFAAVLLFFMKRSISRQKSISRQNS